MTNENEYFSSKDLPLVATLVTLGFNVTNVDYQIEGDKSLLVGYFQFEESPERIDAERKYYGRELAVEPQSFYNNFKMLKSRVNNKYNSPRG